MMNEHSWDRKSLSISEYAAELAKTGTSVVPGATGTVWVEGEVGALMSFPGFNREIPSRAEIRQVFSQGKAAVISFLTDPDKEHPPNAWLYVCSDATYNPTKLSSSVRRNIRQAQRDLRIGPLDWPTLLKEGFAAYSDTRARVGLSDGTHEHFLNRFKRFSINPAHQVIGAWKDDVLLAFKTLIVVDDWVAIEGSFSTYANRKLRPNNGLDHYVLDYFLTQRGFRTVNYGASSIQEDSKADGLHLYKTEIGFEPKPVRRVFILHPLLRPLANRITLWVMNRTLHFRPADRRLLKAIGVLSEVIKEKRESSP